MTASVQQFVDILIDGFGSGGAVEFVDMFSWRLPTMHRRFSSIKLGVPPEQVALYPAFDTHVLMNLPLVLEPATKPRQ